MVGLHAARDYFKTTLMLVNNVGRPVFRKQSNKYKQLVFPEHHVMLDFILDVFLHACQELVHRHRTQVFLRA